ncbi:FRG domain-containing protein [Pectobacterium brasiliense]|uniref:FRG domain-containing protein n=1 Tax=Pectobacterium brasiliense TaxID=180957 RepID=UPI002A829EA5|nr:FRG domain-containing protein [Pectobacterium brasiliense]MDY4326466.1 FRG domain-containing protein [Pectobacterium brasiliense]
MKTIKTDLFGEIYAPETFSQLLEIIDNHIGKEEDRTNVYMWRGQGNIAWPIHSAAYRRLVRPISSRLKPRNVTERLMIDYELKLLKQARHQGYGFENGRLLSDFEVLAKLQHHGAATRLIDFSRNILVALWFACQSERDCTGLLFGLHSDHIYGQEGITEEREYGQIFTESIPPIAATTWQPPVVTKRISAQGAQFMYSSVGDNPMGSLIFALEPKAYLSIAVTKELKENLLTLLEGIFDIRHITLFPDIDGFCVSNNSNVNHWDSDRW